MDTKKISRAFLGLCFITFLISCEDSDVVSYPEYDLSYEMDTTRFLNTGEERTISLKFVRRKAIDNIKTDIWEKVPSSTISISSLNDSFRTQFYPEEQTIKVSIWENRTDEVQTGSLSITINEDQFNQTIAVPLRQDAAQIIYDYKIISEQNPFIIPKTGGEFFIPFICMCQKTINGEKGDWKYSDMKKLRYQVVHTRINGEVHIETNGEIGHYKFHITATDPFEIVEGKQPLWYYVIRTQLFEETHVEYLKQLFVPENFNPEGDYDTGFIMGGSGPIEI